MGGLPLEDDEKLVLWLAIPLGILLFQLAFLVEQLPHGLILVTPWGDYNVHHRLWLGLPSLVSGFLLWKRLPEKRDWLGILVMVFAVAVLLKS